MKTWNDVVIGINEVGKSVVFSFNDREVSFHSSYPMSSTTIRQVLKIISKLEDYLKSEESGDPLDWFKSTFKLMRVDFILDNRIILVQYDVWIAHF